MLCGEVMRILKYFLCSLPSKRESWLCYGVVNKNRPDANDDKL